MSDANKTTDPGLSQDEITEQSAEEMPDREAMSVLSGSLTDPLIEPVEGLLQTTILDQVRAQLPQEAADIDLGAVASGALGDGTDPLGVLPPDMIPDTTVIAEEQDINNQAAA
jgi:hypothetical protein